MTYRAHPVRFAEIDTGEADEDATGAVATIGARRFTVLLGDGTRTLVDLTNWSRPRVAAAFGKVLQEDWRLGGVPSRAAAVKRQMRELRRFFRFLDAQAEPVEVVEAITPAVINRYEVWLERNGGGRIHQRHLLARLISLLRLIAERDPARLSPATVQRLGYLPMAERSRRCCVGRPASRYLSRQGGSRRMARCRRLSGVWTNPRCSRCSKP